MAFDVPAAMPACGELGVDGREAHTVKEAGVHKECEKDAQENGCPSSPLQNGMVDGASPAQLGQGLENSFLPCPPWSSFPQLSPLMQATLTPGDWKTFFPPGLASQQGEWQGEDPAVVLTSEPPPLEGSTSEADPAYVQSGLEPTQLASENEKLAMDNARLAMENQLLRNGYPNPAWTGAGADAVSPALSYWSGDGGSPQDLDMAWAGMGMNPYCPLPWPMMPMGPGGMPMWPYGAGSLPLGSQKQSRARTDSDVGLHMGRAQTGSSNDKGRSRTLSDVHDLHAVGEAFEGPYTTVMLRNLPNNYSRTMLLKLIDAEGFGGQYDLVYLPMDFKSHASLGYAFVNLVDSEQATRFFETFEGFHRWVVPSQKVCSVNWSHPYQGLEAHIERYRNSPVMHEDVPDDYKPMVFRDGKRIPFPPPTKKLKVPRMRPGHEKTSLTEGGVVED